MKRVLQCFKNEIAVNILVPLLFSRTGVAESRGSCMCNVANVAKVPSMDVA